MRAIPYDAVTPITQLVAYTPWAVVPAVVVAAACALFRRWRLTAVAGVCAVTLVAWSAPFYFGYLRAAPPQPEVGAELRVMSANALYGRGDAATIVDLVRSRDVDVLVVLELTAYLEGQLTEAGIDDFLPFRATDAAEEGAGGSGIWSATVLSDVDTSNRSTFAMPSATIDTDHGSVRITAVHPAAPMPDRVDAWVAELEALAERVGTSGAEYEVYAGDFNATYDHASFRALLKGDFVDATRRLGRGMNPSWSWDGNGVLPVDLDHVVTNADVASVESLTIPYSDHRAILAVLDLGIT